MASNNDLAVAVLRVYRARLEAERVGISTAPDVNASLNSNINRPLSESSARNKTSGATLSTSYEVDLWGKLARQRDAAEWASRASEQDLQTARLTLLANAATNYWRIGFLNQQIGVSQASIDYAKETLRLANARYRGRQHLGAGRGERGTKRTDAGKPAADVATRASTDVERTGGAAGRTFRPDHHRARTSADGGNAADQHRHSRQRLEPSPGSQRQRAAVARRSGQRRRETSAILPRLTGSLGTSSSTAGVSAQPDGQSRRRPDAAVPAMAANGVDIKIARNDYEQQVLEFRQALYKAMGDVNNALSLRALLAQEAQLQASLALARKSERLNEVRYRQGAVTITDWLNAQEQRRQAELAVDENRFAQYQNPAKIYLEFGGSSAL